MPPSCLSILVLNKQQAEEYVSHIPYVVISIGDDNDIKANLKNDSKRLDLLRLEFDDVAEPTSNAINSQHANKIVSFALKYSQIVDLFVIHCRAGISRSRGVALGISLILGLNPQEHIENGWPNALVVQRILNAYRHRTGINIDMPIVMRDIVRCLQHPKGYVEAFTHKDMNGHVFGYCHNCQENIISENLDIFDFWISKWKLVK